MQNRKITDAARRLVELATENGKLSNERVETVLETLSANPPRNHLAIVRRFRHAVERFDREHTLVIESATELSESTAANLLDAYSKRYDRTLSLDQTVNPSLIAGMRLRVGDDVYDFSVRGRLASLSPA